MCRFVARSLFPFFWFRRSVGKRNSPVTRALDYLMAPTEAKLVVDTNPYVSKGFHVPQNALDRAAKARKAIWNKPATADEVFRYLQENRGIHTTRTSSCT